MRSFENNNSVAIVLIVIAFLFSYLIRMIWIFQFKDMPEFMWQGQLMINTNDGYYFASAAKSLLENTVIENPQILQAIKTYPGIVYLTYFISKFSPFDLNTVILYMPAVVSSLIVIPIVLTGRLIGHTGIGFFAALLGAVAWSYYNRTVVGYYDSDMFAVLLQFTIFYLFLRIAYKKDLVSVIAASFFIFVYPYFYPQGLTIIFAMYLILVVYLLLEYFHILPHIIVADISEKSRVFYGSITLLGISLMFSLPLSIRFLLFAVVLYPLLKTQVKERYFVYMSVGVLLGLLVFNNLFYVILSKISFFLQRGVSEGNGLHFYQVTQTIREAGEIPLTTVANRISGSSIGLLLSLVGYIFLVIRYRVFIIALPLIGIGLFSLWGGLRFTVYAVPVAAVSIVYLFHMVVTAISNKKSIYIFGMIVMTASVLYPNITHIIGYKVPTVLNHSEVEDLDALRKISHSKDYTISWWDYGYPIWFYSDTNTIIDGGKHQNDNFIVSKIMQTTSPVIAANLGRLAVETYVDSNYSNIADTLFRNGKEDQVDPDIFLSELDDPAYPLPTKSRDIYLYMPYRMLEIFPTVTVFGNIDLKSGNPERRVVFYPGVPVASQKGVVQLNNGIVFDSVRGELLLGKQRVPVKFFAVTQLDKQMHIRVQRQVYHPNSSYVVIFMKSYGKFVVLDEETYRSLYVQMFILGVYDKNYFSLVRASPYSRIYRLKR